MWIWFHSTHRLALEADGGESGRQCVKALSSMVGESGILNDGKHSAFDDVVNAQPLL